MKRYVFLVLAMVTLLSSSCDKEETKKPIADLTIAPKTEEPVATDIVAEETSQPVVTEVVENPVVVTDAPEEKRLNAQQVDWITGIIDYMEKDYVKKKGGGTEAYSYLGMTYGLMFDQLFTDDDKKLKKEVKKMMQNLQKSVEDHMEAEIMHSMLNEGKLKWQRKDVLEQLQPLKDLLEE